jgi:hypothetical protein
LPEPLFLGLKDCPDLKRKFLWMDKMHSGYGYFFMRMPELFSKNVAIIPGFGDMLL